VLSTNFHSSVKLRKAHVGQAHFASETHLVQRKRFETDIDRKPRKSVLVAFLPFGGCISKPLGGAQNTWVVDDEKCAQ